MGFFLIRKLIICKKSLATKQFVWHSFRTSRNLSYQIQFSFKEVQLFTSSINESVGFYKIGQICNQHWQLRSLTNFEETIAIVQTSNYLTFKKSATKSIVYSTQHRFRKMTNKNHKMFVSLCLCVYKSCATNYELDKPLKVILRDQLSSKFESKFQNTLDFIRSEIAENFTFRCLRSLRK